MNPILKEEEGNKQQQPPGLGKRVHKSIITETAALSPKQLFK